MLITPRKSPDCCKQVIAWRVSSPGTNPRTGSWVAKSVSHLRVGLPALSIHLEPALHSAGHPVPVSGVHPHAVITPSHSFQGCGSRGRGARAAPGRRRWPPCRGSPGLWRAILPLQTRRPWGLMPPSRTIATPVAALCTWVESKGDGGVVVY